MLKANLETLVEVSVVGEIWHPQYPKEGTQGLEVSYEGTSFVPIGFAGITYNVKVGDLAFGWAAGDHVEPGVSIKNSDPQANSGLMLLSCVGNEATLISAARESKALELRGEKGTVTGKHGGCNRVLVHFPKKILENLCIGDKLQIRACGTGLKLTDHPHVQVMNCSPTLFKALNISEKGGRIRVPVTKILPGKLIGSGIGNSNPYCHDYDIQSTSPEAIEEYGLDSIHLGDLVALTDFDCTHGSRGQEGAMTVGVVAHGASALSGHGPGVVALLTSAKGAIEPILTRKANLAILLELD